MGRMSKDSRVCPRQRGFCDALARNDVNLLLSLRRERTCIAAEWLLAYSEYLGEGGMGYKGEKMECTCDKAKT